MKSFVQEGNDPIKVSDRRVRKKGRGICPHKGCKSSFPILFHIRMELEFVWENGRISDRRAVK